MNELRQLEEDLGLVGLAAALERGAASAADAERVLLLAPPLLRATAVAEPKPLRQAWEEAPADLLRVLTCLCGAAPFFARVLTRHPDWLPRLGRDDLGAPRHSGEYRARLAAEVEGVALAEQGDALRRFKYYELARITVRELSADLVPPESAGETLGELSHLADALLERALEVAAARLRESAGPPLWRFAPGEDVELAFCVLALGKLGSEELNYSSDVDLIYVFGGRGEHAIGALADGPLGLSPQEYFTRLGLELGHLVTATTEEGFLYRVDLDLRPEGKVGPLVISGDMLANYYELWAATWEKAAFMKARPVAGDVGLGWRTIRTIDPMIYRSAMDFAGVAAIKEMKEKIEGAKEKHGAAFDVKIGAGGIRDVEFVAQALQLLHGGRIPQVRGRSTQSALVALAQVGVLPRADSADLLAAYRFLRRTENRLQMEEERQTHRLPDDLQGMERLARALGFAGPAAAAAADFEATLGRHRERIREIFASLFHEGGTERVLSLFAKNAPQLLASPPTRAMIENLAAHFAHEIDASPDPERAMNNLDRFIHGVGRRRFYYELLIDRPELVPRLTALFAASEYFSTYFATHPRLIEPIFSDPNVLLLSRQELIDDYTSIRAALARESSRDETELGLDALRLFHNRALLNVGLLDLGGKIRVAEAEEALTLIAEVCLEKALEFAEAELQRHGVSAPPRSEFLVVGMGKLASHELTYGSDLDVIFLYDAEGSDPGKMLAAQEYYVRLAQKLIGALRTRTSEGVCYEIDARLRPSGNQGMLVTSRSAFERYHQSGAQVWERQALLRSRPVAGAAPLAAAFEALRREILLRPRPEQLARQVHRIRLRMESELAQETRVRHDFKTGRGGLTDVETVVQYLQLTHAAESPELLRVERVAAQLERLERLGFLEAEKAHALREGWSFLQRLSSRLRIVENRSISDLDEERGDLEALARRLGYAPGRRPGSARRALLEDYRRHTGAIRGIYLEVLGVD